MKKTKAILARAFTCVLAIVAFCAVGVTAGNETESRVKYVFLMIGDGMGVNQRLLPELVTGNSLLMNELPVKGMTRTESAGAPTTDSAAAGTALACGVKTTSGMLGLLPDGSPVESIAEFALKQGYKVGILSTFPPNHATPAAFYAHVRSRNMYDEISADMVRSGFHFFGGEALMASRGSKPAYDLLREAGYNVVNISNASELENLEITGKTYVYRNSRSPALTHRRGDFTLADITAKAIEALDNPNGFFIMVEGAQIDLTSHRNCAAGTVAETIEFDDAIRVAYSFYEKNPSETILIVTADHETGGLSISQPELIVSTRMNSPEVLDHVLSARNDYRNLVGTARQLRQQNASFDDVVQTLASQFNIEEFSSTEIEMLRAGWEVNESERRQIFRAYEPLAIMTRRVIDGRLGIGWSTVSHSEADIETTAVGVGAARFSGSYHLKHIAIELRKMMTGTDVK